MLSNWEVAFDAAGTLVWKNVYPSSITTCWSKYQIGHPAFLGGAPGAGAGEISVHNGVIQWISNVSGHYRPSTTATYQILAWLGVMRSYPNFIVIVPPNGVEGFPSIVLTIQ